MPEIKRLQSSIKEELIEFEKRFKNSMKSSVPLLDRVTHYIVQRKGKQVRPMFVFLSAKLVSEVKSETYLAASLIELLHTSSLVHDDVVDDSNMRRGFFSINALWKNKIAVLVGDFLLSKGLLLAVENEEYDLLKIVSQAVKELCEGEMLQMEKTRTLNISEDIYFSIIRQKTASLIAASCAAGMRSVTEDSKSIDRMREFGYSAGIAFQLKDDLFDYELDDIGKPTGIDLKEKKLTLPLIYTMNKVSSSQKSLLKNLIKNHSHDKNCLPQIVSIVKEEGGIDYAIQKMNDYRDQAISLLAPFPDSSAKTGLTDLVQFVVNRKK